MHLYSIPSASEKYCNASERTSRTTEPPPGLGLLLLPPLFKASGPLLRTAKDTASTHAGAEGLLHFRRLVWIVTVNFRILLVASDSFLGQKHAAHANGSCESWLFGGALWDCSRVASAISRKPDTPLLANIHSDAHKAYMVTRSAAPPLPPPPMVYGPGCPPSCGMECGFPLPPVGWLWRFWGFGSSLSFRVLGLGSWVKRYKASSRQGLREG